MIQQNYISPNKKTLQRTINLCGGRICMSNASMKCNKGHSSNGLYFREGGRSVIRIFNYWYCKKCNQVFKKKPIENTGVYAK